MIPRKYRLKITKDSFQRKNNKVFQGRNIGLLLKKQIILGNPRFAIIVSQKVSKKAVIRNKVKRRLSSAIIKNINIIKKGYQIIILAKKNSVEENFKQLEEDLIFTLKKASLIKPSNK